MAYIPIIAIIVALILFITSRYVSTLNDPTCQDFINLKNRIDGRTKFGVIDKAQSNVDRLLNWSHRIFEQDKTLTDAELDAQSKHWRFFWSAKALDQCLLLAIIYPLASAFFFWGLFGEAGKIGEVMGLPSGSPLHFTWLTLIGISVSAIYYYKAVHMGGWQGPVGQILSIGFALFILLRLPILLGQAPIGPAFLLFIIFPVAVAFAFPVAFAVAFAVAVAVAGAFPVAFAFAFAFAFAVDHKPKYLPRILLTLILFLGALCFILPASGFAKGGDQNWLVIIMALTLIPIINALFDWGSTGWTRFCLTKAAQMPKHRFGWALCDVIAALLWMLGLLFVMILLLEGFNHAVQIGGHESGSAPISEQILAIRESPRHAGNYWVYFALFTTLLPTLIHVILRVFSLMGLMFGGTVNKFIAPMLELDYLNRGPISRTLPAGLLALQWMFAGFLVMAVPYCLYFIIIQIIPQSGGIFLDFADWSHGIARALFD